MNIIVISISFSTYSDSLIESCLKDIIKAENVDMSKPGNVMIGMDTRYVNTWFYL